MSDVMFTNVRVFDGGGEAPFMGDVLVQSNSISRIVKTGYGQRSVPVLGAQVIDGAGAFLMPGMVEAHTHFSWNNQPGLESIQRMPPEEHILFKPQASLLVGDDGATLLTDAIGRVEDMQGSYDAICARIGISSQPLEHVNGSQHGDYRQYYDQALIDGVAARYAQDLELFGYGFEGPR